MGSLDHQGVGHYEPILRFQQVNSHPVHAEQIRAGALIRLFPHSSCAQNLPESIGVDSPENLRDYIEQVRAYGFVAGELRCAV